MSRRARRHVRNPPDLTSLFDVLFIVIFVALIRAAAAQQAAEAAKPKPAPPPPPAVELSRSQLHVRALAEVDKQFAARTPVIVRVSAAGSLTSLEAGDKATALDTPLTEHSPDPDVALAYLGDRSAELRVCRVVAVHLGVADLASHLVIIAPERRLVDLSHALYEGLRRDVERCLFDQKGFAVIVDPSVQ